METAAQSGESSIAEELLQFFVERKERECFAAMLYTCYDLIKPDQALELAWTNGLVDFVMPYMIQYLKDYTGKVNFPALIGFLDSCSQSFYQTKTCRARRLKVPRVCSLRKSSVAIQLPSSSAVPG